MSRRAVLRLLLALAGVGLWMLAREADAEDAGRGMRFRSPPARLATLEGSCASAMERREVDTIPARIVDALTGEDVPGELHFACAEGSPHTLRAGDPIRLAWPCVRDRAILRVRDEEWQIPWPVPIERTDLAWTLHVPDASRIEARWTDSASPTQSWDLLLCVTEAQERPSQGPFQGPNPAQTRSGRLLWDLRAKVARVAERIHVPAGSSAAHFTRLRGEVALLALRADGACAVADLRLAPGTESSAALEPRMRPLLRCRVQDVDGAALPHARVTLTVGLDLADFDLRPDDGVGFLAVRRAGLPHQGARQSYRADAQGWVEIRAPRGHAYSLEAQAGEAAARWSWLQAAATELGPEIVLRLAPPDPQRAARLRVRGPRGEAWTAGAMDVAVAGDVTLFRQWPQGLTLDSRGEAWLAEVEPGTRLGVILRHPSLRGGIYAPPYPYVEADGSVWIHVPDSAMAPDPPDAASGATGAG